MIPNFIETLFSFNYYLHGYQVLLCEVSGSQFPISKTDKSEVICLTITAKELPLVFVILTGSRYPYKNWTAKDQEGMISSSLVRTKELIIRCSGWFWG